MFAATAQAGELSCSTLAAYWPLHPSKMAHDASCTRPEHIRAPGFISRAGLSPPLSPPLHSTARIKAWQSWLTLSTRLPHFNQPSQG